MTEARRRRRGGSRNSDGAPVVPDVPLVPFTDVTNTHVTAAVTAAIHAAFGTVPPPVPENADVALPAETVVNVPPAPLEVTTEADTTTGTSFFLRLSLALQTLILHSQSSARTRRLRP